MACLTPTPGHGKMIEAAEGGSRQRACARAISLKWHPFPKP